MSTFIHMPPSDELVLRPGDRIACRNATIIVDANDNFAGWVDNDAMIPVFTKDGKDDS